MEQEMFGKELDYLNLSYGANYSSPYSNITDALESAMALHQVTLFLNIYILPVIILIGILGNSVSFLVYVMTPRLCRQSSSVYLAFLAAVDNMFLVSVFVVWFGFIGMQVFHKDGWCQIISYCTYVCGFLSVWTVVSFTVERWIVVFHPLKRHRLCTRKRAIILMTSLTLGSLAFYSFSIFTQHAETMGNRPVCTQVDKPYHFLQAVRSLDTIITIIIPFITIIVMNTAIGIKICRYASRRKTLEANPESGDDMFSGFSSGQRHSESARHQPSAISLVSQSTRAGTNVTSCNNNQKPRSWRFFTRRQQTQLRITRALLVVSSVFILLNLPSYAFRIHAFVITIQNRKYDILEPSVIVWQEFIQFCYYTNFSSNFFLYCACSRNFRYALRRLWNRLRRRLSKLGTLSFTVSVNTSRVRTRPRGPDARGAHDEPRCPCSK